MSEHVSVEQPAPGVLLVRLNRPEKKNALTGEMYGALAAALARANNDPDIRAAVITGSGGSFTAGNDLADFLAVANGEVTERPAGAFIAALADTTKPLVAAVDGVAVGIGTTLTFHCDLVYATPATTFRMPFVDLGLVPEAGSTHLLPNRIGRVRATELLLLGEPYGAEEAVRLGLVNAVVPADQLLPHAIERAEKLAAKPAAALQEARRLIRGQDGPLRAALEAEYAAFTRALRTPEAKAAFDSFMKRSPKREAPSG